MYFLRLVIVGCLPAAKFKHAVVVGITVDGVVVVVSRPYPFPSAVCMFFDILPERRLVTLSQVYLLLRKSRHLRLLTWCMWSVENPIVIIFTKLSRLLIFFSYLTTWPVIIICRHRCSQPTPHQPHRLCCSLVLRGCPNQLDYMAQLL